jgi:hypothetical protein
LKRKLLAAAYWTVPSLVCLAIYWPGLRAWFQQDDFVWLNLINQAHGWHGLLTALFQPTVHGTWRPLSERAFFLAFGAMFGDYALPYRIWVFLTQCANLVLLASITTRLTRSRAAGFWAAILWIANSTLATVMSWSCEYILVACGFFLLLALHFFLRYIETGERRFYGWTWAAFLTGFLAMETNIVFPLLVGSYTLFCARKYFRRTLPFFLVSAMYAALHLLLAPNHGARLYAVHFDSAIPSTVWSYWQQAFEPFNLRYLTPFPTAAGVLEMAACTAALAGFTIARARRREWLPLVLLAWFFFTLGPVIPLRNHISNYYLTLPVMCLAMLGADALVCAWRAGMAWKAAGAVLTAGFLVLSIPVGYRAADWYQRRSEAVEHLVGSVARAHELHPGKVILLEGIGDQLFWGAISQRPFLYLRIPDVYLAPGSAAHITAHPDVDDVSMYVLPADQVKEGLDRGEIVVYRVGPGPLKNITNEYVAPDSGPPGREPLVLDVADPLAADRLGPTWYPREGRFRWMPRSATVQMPGPRSGAQKLYVTAVCPALQLDQGPLQMRLSIDGIALPPVQFTQPNRNTTFTFALPPESIGKSRMEIRIEVGRTVRVSGDTRDLGVAFGRFEIK